MSELYKFFEDVLENEYLIDCTDFTEKNSYASICLYYEGQVEALFKKKCNKIYNLLKTNFNFSKIEKYHNKYFGLFSSDDIFECEFIITY